MKLSPMNTILENNCTGHATEFVGDATQLLDIIEELSEYVWMDNSKFLISLGDTLIVTIV